MLDHIKCQGEVSARHLFAGRFVNQALRLIRLGQLASAAPAATPLRIAAGFVVSARQDRQWMKTLRVCRRA
ncbi:hypothetical protein ACFV2N_46700 [Streptomyces sp. NPDC059680]|uniref:hypothetical protein n=1 Tax=Streptomyces sp. NPDC059680 TaxID=3346904 RepID=UPI00369C3D68